MKSNIKEEYYKPLIEIIDLNNNVVTDTSTGGQDPGTEDPAGIGG